MSIVAGVERGGTPGERFGWAAVALVVLLAAHLLPALTRGDRSPVRLPAALQMLEPALDAGVPCGWVTGDEVYGGDRHLRLWLESREQPFVLAVAKNEPLWWQGPAYVRADRIAESLPARAWRRLSAGAGAKGERLYDWALAPLWRLQITAEERRFGHYLLIRRSLDEKREHAYYVVYAPRTKASRQTLVNVAGRRWEIEIGFEAAKGECGLDQYEVRRWQGWYRHIAFALLVRAVLATLRARGKKTPDGVPCPRSPNLAPYRSRWVNSG
ncbi:transposase [Burkholderia ubonensis]|uniref:IS701 family transposase n=1 Tax=Burkholderia ubonensis TaxID=101571 RepID=UPI002FC72167